MKQSIVTDELSSDPETAFELGLEWGVDRFELRGVHDGRVPLLSPHVRQGLVRAVRSFGVSITAISPGLFKCPFPAGEPARSNLGWMDAGFYHSWQDARSIVENHRLNLLPASIDFAREVGAKYIIAFSFSRSGAPAGSAPEGVTEMLAEAAEATRAAGFELLVETEEGFWADTGARSAALIGRVGSPGLGINWDPANALIEGDVPFPEGYAALKHLVRNVHFKDARRYPDGTWELLADGDVDWAGQIAALVTDGYDGAIAVEPHLSPSVASTRATLARLRSLIDQAATIR
ncbi:xylose isomerase [Mesorhizobium sp. L-8-10]|uniref:sugar phosphate isomerase/epimerase family protein n=1 Tax=Mesorhizobium sp. L-8-10 TaxID=2744523 RepID=UPI0019286FBE|nr:sugar phosphate isomerase/epimerase family protein [Mesorhizobium sp. L-8-10]BCH35624.1 xylose isomerase [Mesorhizobium sp. L-8-10]